MKDNMNRVENFVKCQENLVTFNLNLRLQGVWDQLSLSYKVSPIQNKY